MYRAFETHFPKWRETPQVIDRIAAKLKNNNSKNSKVIGRDITPNAITPDNCQDAFNAAPSFTDYSAATTAAIAADGLQNVIPPPFNAIATGVYIAAAEGALVAETLNAIYDRCSGDRDTADILTSIGNVQTSVDTIVSNADTNATNILNSISSATTTITTNDDSNKTMLVNNAAANTTIITNAVTNAKNDIVNNDNSNKTMITTAITNAQTAVITAGDANSAAIINNDNSNKTMIVNNDTANATTLNINLRNAKNTIIANDNTNTTNIVNNDNANKMMIVNNDNANAQAIQDALLRSQIEADLATESNGVKVAWYMTSTANGGKLDLVKSIVTLNLANIQAAASATLSHSLTKPTWTKQPVISNRRMTITVRLIKPRLTKNSTRYQTLETYFQVVF